MTRRVLFWTGWACGHVVGFVRGVQWARLTQARGTPAGAAGPDTRPAVIPAVPRQTASLWAAVLDAHERRVRAGQVRKH